MNLRSIRDHLPDWHRVKAIAPTWETIRAVPKKTIIIGSVATLVVGLGGFGIYAFWPSGEDKEETSATSSEQLPALVPVTRADLRDDFTVNAKLAAESNLSYSLPTPEGERTVVTAGLKQPGDVLHTGLPIIEINDRPILAFVGDIPMYRTIVRGVRGGDVERLQQALAQLGYNVTVDGRFGKQSEVALRKHFKSIGSTVPLCPVVEPISEQPKKGGSPSEKADGEKKSEKKSDKKSGSSNKRSKTISGLIPFDWVSAFTPIFADEDANPGTNDEIRREQEERERRDADEERQETEDAERRLKPGQDGGSGDGGNSGNGGGSGKQEKPGIGDGKSDTGQNGESVAPCLRVSDAIFIPVANAKIISIPKTGDILAGEAKVVVTDGSSGLVATVPEAEAENLKPGLEATALYKNANVAITVVSVNEVKKTEDGKPLPEGAPKSFTVTFAPKEQGIFNDIGDQQVLLTVPRSTPILGQLVVPQRAISQDATGATSVLTQRGNQFEAVRVESLGCVAGQCAINPTNGQLREGDMVRVDQA